MRFAQIPLLALVAAPHLAAADWPQFRGPGGDGHSAEARAPLEWSDEKNIAWRTPVPGLGWSSPVLLAGKLWLTTALENGKSLRALCLDARTGKLDLDVEVFHIDNPGKVHNKNSHASPTPILEPDRVYVHFGAHGTACLDDKGKVLWQRQLKYAHGHGPAGSPLAHGDVLFITCDGTDEQFVIALEKKTGAVRWRTDRQGRMAYSTPLVIHFAGRDQLITTGGGAFVAYDSVTGTELWRTRHDGYSLVPKPVFGQGLLFLCSGYDEPTLQAVRPDGQGDVTRTHVVWTLKRRAPLNPSPLLVDGQLYIVSDDGIASALDPGTGATLWQERLGGAYSASPIFAAGRIYFLSEEGLTTVVEPGKKPRKLRVNEVAGRTLASLAVADGAIYLRTDKDIIKISD